MRFNEIILIGFSVSSELVSAHSDCSNEDYVAIGALDPLATRPCLGNSSASEWVSTCFVNVSETCGNALDIGVRDFINNVCASLEDADFQPCKAASLALVMAKNSPGGSVNCSAADGTSMWDNANMTAMTACSDGSIIGISGCFYGSLDVSPPCHDCIHQVTNPTSSVCTASCDGPGTDDTCTACVNTHMTAGMANCMYASGSTGLVSRISAIVLLFTLAAALAL